MCPPAKARLFRRIWTQRGNAAATSFLDMAASRRVIRGRESVTRFNGGERRLYGVAERASQPKIKVFPDFDPARPKAGRLARRKGCGKRVVRKRASGGACRDRRQPSSPA